jgi:hypothetical protein
MSTEDCGTVEMWIDSSYFELPPTPPHVLFGTLTKTYTAKFTPPVAELPHESGEAVGMPLQGWRLDCGWAPCIPTIGLHYDLKAEAEMAASMTQPLSRG